jgi:hypothetical protein
MPIYQQHPIDKPPEEERPKQSKLLCRRRPSLTIYTSIYYILLPLSTKAKTKGKVIILLRRTLVESKPKKGNLF